MEKLQRGFTLIELLIVVAIIALLSMVVFMNLRGQAAHATDIKRKGDLYNLSKAFEDYNNDNGVFPVQSAINACGVAMGQYLVKIPCDPVAKAPYGYFPSANGGYRICAKLSDTTDPAIATMNCAGPAGCGLGGPPSGGVYNYCMASGVTASAVGTPDAITPTPGGVGIPTPTPTPGGGGPASSPTPTPTPNYNPTYHYVCTNGGACNWYDVPSNDQHRCPIAWEFNCPTGACPTPANRCAD